MPRPIRLYMLSRRVRKLTQARSKNGQPPHSTTGVASASCPQAKTRSFTTWRIWAPQIISAMAARKSGRLKPTHTQKRRVMSSRWTSSTASSVTVRGSSAMPQIGQLPGASRTISGCIGQVHCTFAPVGTTGGAARAA